MRSVIKAKRREAEPSSWTYTIELSGEWLNRFQKITSALKMKGADYLQEVVATDIRRREAAGIGR